MSQLFRFESLANDNFKDQVSTTLGIAKLDVVAGLEERLTTKALDYLWQIGLCIPCIYRILHNYSNIDWKIVKKKKSNQNIILILIDLELESLKHLKCKNNAVNHCATNDQSENLSKECFICNDLFVKLRKQFDGIKITNLKLSNEKEFDMLKKNLTSKRKKYRCVCCVNGNINEKIIDNINKFALKEINDNGFLLIKQDTPVRVLHRRSPMIRDKKVYELKLEYINPHWLIVDLLSEAGMYIKEFIHGDRGRTYPNLASLTNCMSAQIIQLDVLDLFLIDQKLNRIVSFAIYVL